jgi:hypothetical protein
MVRVLRYRVVPRPPGERTQIVCAPHVWIPLVVLRGEYGVNLAKGVEEHLAPH